MLFRFWLWYVQQCITLIFICGVVHLNYFLWTLKTLARHGVSIFWKSKHKIFLVITKFLEHHSKQVDKLQKVSHLLATSLDILVATLNCQSH